MAESTQVVTPGLAPGGEPSIEPASLKPQDILFSPDGINWEPLLASADHPGFAGASATVAGDAIFLSTEDETDNQILVGKAP